MGSATAHISIHAFDDLGPRHSWVLEQQAIGGHDHAGGAETALKGTVVSEGFLQRMEGSISGQSLDGCNLLPAHLPHWNLAGSYGLFAYDHGSRAAKACAATEFGPREAQVRAQDPQKHAVTFYL